ncbi:hypothetical protein GCM10022220_69610 [Actinocatenispora rupis]|uniref:Uncharacterized protein n=1 Tax=Actinocatenispora rupis TaxID=519421 RepID=A0A8J3IZB3_9ACTN|nr:hypothetical protein Aru02nite_00190 [Actinocatenispora rupis]
MSDEPTATYPAARPAPTPPQPPTSQQPAPQPPAEPAPQPQPAAAPYQQTQQAQQQPGTPLSELLHDATQYTEPVGPYPTTPAPTRDDGVYRAGGRPQLAWLLAAAAVLFEIPVVFVLVRSLAASGIVVSGVVSGLLLLPGVPLFAAGLYHLFSGHIAVRPGEGAAALTRRPLAVLLVGTVLLVAGAMAAG